MELLSSKFIFNFLQLYNCKSKLKKLPLGFTLTELLVAVIVASLAISGLLSLMISLLQTDQKETAQTETQQQLQMALDSISADLREAVYVYDGTCLQAGGSASCPNLASYIPTPSNSMPILAFWKLQPFPQTIQTQCTSTNPPANVNCSAGRSYSLVIYYLRQNQSTDSTPWQGPARITRYQLTQFDSNGNAVTGYVDPSSLGSSGFQSWPKGGSQSLPSQLSSDSYTFDLVDSVDFTTPAQITCPNPGNTNPPPYLPSPSTGVTAFYACVKALNGSSGVNQDVMLFLTGNASGKPGLNNNFRPTLQTDVIIRGVINKTPLS